MSEVRLGGDRSSVQVSQGGNLPDSPNSLSHFRLCDAVSLLQSASGTEMTNDFTHFDVQRAEGHIEKLCVVCSA